MDTEIIKNWHADLKNEINESYFIKLQSEIDSIRKSETVYPSEQNVFKAFEKTPFDKVKAVILGQDPYHQPGQAHGLSFSVEEGTQFPKSLQNIFKEYQDDTGHNIPFSGSLLSWAEQGVLLLNTVLTVTKDNANSHKNIGWEQFTDKVISTLNKKDTPIVFILWGKHAQEKQKIISKKHFTICSPHPSPLSSYRGFFGSKPFSKTNEILISARLEPINWKL